MGNTPTSTVNVLMSFKLLTLHWSICTHADNNGESPESLKECNVSEETESTADAREIPVVHSPSKILMMVCGTWSETPHGAPTTAIPTPQESSLRISKSVNGSTPLSLHRYSILSCRLWHFPTRQI